MGIPTDLKNHHNLMLHIQHLQITGDIVLLQNQVLLSFHFTLHNLFHLTSDFVLTFVNNHRCLVLTMCQVHSVSKIFIEEKFCSRKLSG